MRLFGLGASHPGVTYPDEYWLDPPRDLAIVTSGLGVHDLQARVAAVLSLWSIVGEVAENKDEDALARGARRAHEALKRVTLGWQGLLRPAAMVAAVQLSGSGARIAHAGRCRISRARAGALEPLTEDHDLAAAAAAAAAAVAAGDSTSCPALPIPPELARMVTRALGVTEELEVRHVPLEPGDELLLATPALHERLTPAVVAEVCRQDRPLAARAVTLFDHACAHDGPFAFILVRAVPDGPCPGAAGRTYPPSKSFYFAPGEPLPPPVPGLDRGPDERWEKEIANPLAYRGSPPLDAELRMLVDLHPPELATVALIRAIRWSLGSLATRFREVPAPLDALIRAAFRTDALADWGDSSRAIEQAFYEWASDHLGDWASDQAVDRLKGALDCLIEWARCPERPEKELGSVLEDLVVAEGMWDWDELAAEADLSGFAPIPDSYWDMEVHRDERRLAARRALILVLTEVAPEPWKRAVPVQPEPVSD